MEDRKKTFINRLRQAMDERGMKAIDLSRKSGIDKGSISHILNDGQYPKVENLQKLAKALNVSYAWLSGVEDELINFLQTTKSPSNQAVEDFELLEQWHKLDDDQKAAIKNLIATFLKNP